MKKSNIEGYIKELEKIQNDFPDVSERIEAVITQMSDDYCSFINKELERQKYRRRESLRYMEERKEFKQIESLDTGMFLVVSPADKLRYREAKNAVITKYEDRKFTIRFMKDVGIVLTRIQ